MTESEIKDFQLRMQSAHHSLSWYEQVTQDRERAERAKEQERLDAIPKWHLWLLNRLPRSIALICVSFGQIALQLIGWSIVGVIAMAAFVGAMSAFFWAVVIIVSIFNHDVLGGYLPIILEPLPSFLAFIEVVLLLSYGVASIYSKADKELPKREKKHDA